MATFKTSDLCDLHGDAVQVCHAQLANYGGRPWLAGYIATVQTFEDAGLIRRSLEQPGEGRVLVVDGGGSRRAAVLGDKMAHLAMQNGWSGIVIHGAVRDVETLGSMDLAVLALGAVPLRGGMTGKGATGGTLQFGGATFLPGHCIYGDPDGLVTSARELRSKA